MFGEILVKLRKQKKLTQEELASILGVARTTYSSYEQNRRMPDSEIQNKISDYYGVSLDYLHGRSEKLKTSDNFSEQEETDIQKEVERLMSDIKNGNYILEGEELSEDAKESLRGAFENAVRTAILINRNTK
ncbi:helix-turn-helix domain-containing protein [Listeria newyorkensis]|uniref:Helix-turn-helix transcriptional regulator n=1 Tax=Listeria newyorkensis TaxID=1497681 RepID=A0A841YZG3_9LIST|nr:helix-turn-helix transcriptional regulator [Listeria newyorkensis]MBC1459321.1 helix-turn-helix transcriptional regulator [Listeria newyorkensis]